jgi:hypothetical protein
MKQRSADPVWLRGTYRAYTDYNLAVVGIIARRQGAAVGHESAFTPTARR